MKNKSLICSVFLFFLINQVSATNVINFYYNSEQINVCQFFCYHEELEESQIQKDKLEDFFYQFFYLIDSLHIINSKTKSTINFYSENGISEIKINDKSYIFVSKTREKEIKKSVLNYVLTEDYNDVDFLINYLCKITDIKTPTKKKIKKLYSIETESQINSDIEEKLYLFFMPGGDLDYSPEFILNNRNYIGFYYTKKEANKMKEYLKKKYLINCKINQFPCDYEIIKKIIFQK